MQQSPAPSFFTAPMSGQWTLALSKLNSNACSIDVDEPRLKAAELILKLQYSRNTRVDQQSIEKLQFDDEQFDADFCYGVLCFCDHRESLKEFFRVLKPGGRLYIFCTNGLGWYIYNVLTPDNASEHFDIRQMAIEAIQNGLMYLANGSHPSGQQIVIPSAVLANDAASTGFESVNMGASHGDQGHIARSAPGSFFGMRRKNVMLAKKHD